MEYATQKIWGAVISGRLNILEEFQEPFQQMHQQLVGNEKVSLAIQGSRCRSFADAVVRFEQEMQRNLAEEVRRKQVIVGPHRDDLEILMNGMPARRFASQGQTRSIIVALKLAELEAAKLRGRETVISNG